MSLILAGGNKDFLIVGADQRVLDKEGKVLSEYYRKVYRANEDMIVAFAGKIRYCEEVLGPVLEHKKVSDHPLTNVELTDMIESNSQRVADRIADSFDKDCFFGIIACGKTLHGQPRDSKRNPYFMHLYAYNGKLSVNKNMLRDYGIRWSALYGSRYNHKKVCKDLFSRTQTVSLEETKRVFNQTFHNGAKFDRTMNDKVLYEMIED
ncbi:MAG: hypothetical protein Q4B70_11640 [Lachnospiraceae bacterium]|nr:hypothetical protein [Lachnospiraceae bacterium]